MIKMRHISVTLLSVFLTFVVIGNAYYQKQQFYPSVVYITKSNPSMAVIYIQALVLVILLGKLMRKIFFGQLRATEFEHLVERSWYAITETCLAFTVFKDDFSPKFVALFTLVLFLKSFHWLAEDRVDFMERSPNISYLFHFRVLLLLVVLGLLDLHFVAAAYQSTVTKGASVQLVFGFEYAILLTVVFNIAVKYVLHTVDLNREIFWENKAVFLLYMELVMGFIKVVLYVFFVVIMIRFYTLPLFAFRPMYYAMRNFKKALIDVILSRRAIRNMNTLYPDVNPEELTDADNVCIICREEMQTASKRLPCNHIFHTSCLRSWFQRHQTCPTCRLNILRTPAPQQTQPMQPRMNQNRPAEPRAQPMGPQDNAFIPPPFAFPWIPQQPPNVQPNAADAAANQPGAQQEPAAAPTGEQPPPTDFSNFQFFCPPFPFFGMPIPPPPTPPSDLSNISEEELRKMEQASKEGIEARLRCLRNIQLLLDASVAMMQQYVSAANTAELAANASQSGAASTSSSNVRQPGAEGASTSSKESSPLSAEPSPSSQPQAGPSSSSSSLSEQEDIRKRRLQKFDQAAK
ncbi:unnamed protein product [Bemisia tabaci]|uniref:RING-type E3 ubiquitin transferase n=1 Tax=Bemisia tabaci TaxID=7038 RepID=A0A9P0FAV4_BEMTA|nr:unnamed protein product [Bemisia tabaci]